MREFLFSYRVERIETYSTPIGFFIHLRQTLKNAQSGFDSRREASHASFPSNSKTRCAGRENRTLILSAHGFESCASTNSATAAYYCFQLAGEVKAGGSRVRLPIPPSRQHRISLS